MMRVFHLFVCTLFILFIIFYFREEEYISNCDCFVFILQNAKAKIKTVIDQNTMLKIKKAWENIHHVKQKN